MQGNVIQSLYLRDEAVQVGVGGPLDVQGAPADVVDGLVVEQDGDICVLQQRVGGQHTVVGLNNRGRHLRRRVHSETQLGLLSIVHGQALEEERAKAGSSSTTDGVEDKEALKASAVVGQLADAVQAEIHNLLADCRVKSRYDISNETWFHRNQLSNRSRERFRELLV
jgi:hypothetical protein